MILAMRAVVALVTAVCLGTCGVVSASENPPGATTTAGLMAYPNPAHDVIHIAFKTALPGSLIVTNYQVRATVHNVTGQLVRRLRDGPINLGSGDHGEIVWDGRTESGQRVPSGFYFIRIVRNGQVSVLKVWYIR